LIGFIDKIFGLLVTATYRTLEEDHQNMSTARSNNYSIAIIGAGLVGGAILHELVLGWVRAHGGASSLGQPSKISSAEHLGVEKI